MAQNEYYPEDVLVGKMQSGEYGWLDYVNHFSADWQEEYARYCEEKGLAVGNESAAEFVRFKDEQLEAAMESGDAQRRQSDYGDTNEYQSPADGLAARNARYADAQRASSPCCT